HPAGLSPAPPRAARPRGARDKLTLILPDRLAPFGAWIEQLVAGATGRDGAGLIPVAGEPPGPPLLYGKDRLFVHLRLGSAEDRVATSLATAGHPVVAIALTDGYDLGGEILRWEIAVAAASRLLGVHPFAEPDTLELEAAARRELTVGSGHPVEPLLASTPDFAARLGTQVAAAAGRRL